MSTNNNLESGFAIKNLILLESNFTRKANVTFESEDITKKLDVNVDVNIDANIITVTLEVIYKQFLNDEDEVSSVIKMVGVFEKIGNAKLDLEEFGKVNGAAIIFPYVREHLTNLTAKAGLGLLILPKIKKHSVYVQNSSLLLKKTSL